MPGILCEHCTALCCRYIALPIDTPAGRGDFDDIRWYLMHEGISVFVEDGDWYIAIQTACRHLQPDNRCGVYETRPRICREYSTENCDYHSGDYNWQYHFACPEHLDEYVRLHREPQRRGRNGRNGHKGRNGRNGGDGRVARASDPRPPGRGPRSAEATAEARASGPRQPSAEAPARSAAPLPCRHERKPGRNGQSRSKLPAARGLRAMIHARRRPRNYALDTHDIRGVPLPVLGVAP